MEDTVLKVYVRKHVAIRKEAVYPGVQHNDGVAEPGNILGCVETKEQIYTHKDGDPYNITLFRLEDGRGWIHDFNPSSPKAGGILTVLGSASSPKNGGVLTVLDSEKANDDQEQDANVYDFPLIYFDSSSSLLKDLEETPTQFVTPNKKIYLGAPPPGASKENEKCMVFSFPRPADQRARVGWILILCPLFLIDLLIIAYAYVESVSNGNELTTWDKAGLTCTASTLLLGLYGVLKRDLLLITLFSVVFTIDMVMSILNLITMGHSVAQIAIFYSVGNFRKTLASSWNTIHPRRRS